MTDEVRIVLDNSVAKSWLNIDAVKLTGKTLPKGIVIDS